MGGGRPRQRRRRAPAAAAAGPDHRHQDRPGLHEPRAGPGQYGVPASGGSAVVLNLTETAGQPPGGYVTVYPDGPKPPLASDLNYVPGASVANLVIVQVGSDGKIALYNGSKGSTDLIV